MIVLLLPTIQLIPARLLNQDESQFHLSFALVRSTEFIQSCQPTYSSTSGQSCTQFLHASWEALAKCLAFAYEVQGKPTDIHLIKTARMADFTGLTVLILVDCEYDQKDLRGSPCAPTQGLQPAEAHMFEFQMYVGCVIGSIWTGAANLLVADMFIAKTKMNLSLTYSIDMCNSGHLDYWPQMEWNAV